MSQLYPYIKHQWSRSTSNSGTQSQETNLNWLPETSESTPYEISEFKHYTTVTEQVNALKSELKNVKSYIEDGCKSIPIATLGSDSYEVLKPFFITIEPVDDQYLATWFDANIGTSGDFESEAIDNLKEIIIETYEIILEHHENDLGPGPKKQLVVLREFIKQK